MADIYYCGKCKRYQTSDKGERCISCNGRTMTVINVWDEKQKRNRPERDSEIHERWVRQFGSGR